MKSCRALNRPLLALMPALALLAPLSLWPLSSHAQNTPPQTTQLPPQQETTTNHGPPLVTADAMEQAKRRGLFIASEGDAAAGRQVVINGGSAGAGAACVACHGLQGEGHAAAGFPRLAGQSAYYLAKQLNNYRDGSRPNEVMTPIASQLSEAERRDVAAYLAQLIDTKTSAHGGSAAEQQPSTNKQRVALIQRGSRLALQGSAALGVQACNNCHGPQGQGIPPDAPYLASQVAGYAERQLTLWQQGTRRNDSQGVMRDIANRLPEADRQAVAAYFASLPLKKR